MNSDAIGVVTAVGALVNQWKVGDIVLTHGNMFRPHGAFAEYSVQAAASCIAAPAGIDAVTLAATPCAGWTVYRCLHAKLRLQPRDTLLILGAAGGCGSFASQLARLVGCKTIIGTSSAKNHAHLRELGCTHAIDYKYGTGLIASFLIMYVIYCPGVDAVPRM